MAAEPKPLGDNPFNSEEARIWLEAILGKKLEPWQEETLAAVDQAHREGKSIVFVGLDRASTIDFTHVADFTTWSDPLFITQSPPCEVFSARRIDRDPDPAERAIDPPPKPAHKRSLTDRAAQGAAARADMVARAMRRRK